MIAGPADTADQKLPLVEGPVCFHTVLATDSMSMVTALTATAFRVPRGTGFTIHLFWLKEKLVRRQVGTLQWLDTRDISCDGHTKGAVDRTTLKKLQQGSLPPKHATKEYHQLGMGVGMKRTTAPADSVTAQCRGSCHLR